jgi:hypothetical protein
MSLLMFINNISNNYLFLNAICRANGIVMHSEFFNFLILKEKKKKERKKEKKKKKRGGKAAGVNVFIPLYPRPKAIKLSLPNVA